MSADIRPTELTESDYNVRTRAVLASVEAQIDLWLEADVIDIDTQRAGGLLELSFPNGSKIILNTQQPLHELWMAARSGGYHYKFVGASWIDTREGTEFFEALSTCASQQAGQPLRFTPPG